MATAFPVRAQTALRALSRDIPMRRSEPYPPSSHLAKFSTSTPSRVWGSCLVRVMRIFGNASPMDRIGAISLSSVESAPISSLTYTFLPGFETWKAVCARMRRGAIPVVPCKQRCRGTFVHAAMRASEMKNSPSGSHGRAGARISNLPPRLSLLCMVVYIKEEPAMQISMLALLGSPDRGRRGARPSGTGPRAKPGHIRRNDKARSLCWSGCRSRAVRQSECGSGCCNVIPAAGYGSFAVAAKPAGNILTIRMMYASLGIVSPDQGHLQRLIGQLGRRLFHA